MKSKALITLAIAATFASAGALAADTQAYNPARDTLDVLTGGFKGFGPMPNPVSALSDRESTIQRDQDLIADRNQHLQEVLAARQRVWVANAPLRAPYENIGATRSSAGGIVQYFKRGEYNEEVLETK